MKRIIRGLFIFMLTFVSLKSVYAATANISVSGSKSVVVGNTFKVTTKVSSSDLGAWEYCISYDSNVLKLEGSTANSGSCVKAGVVGQTGQSETWTFKAIKSGSSKVTIRSYAVYSMETEQQMSTSVGSINVTARTYEEIQASYSKNNNLKTLGVESYVLSPEFNKDVKEYTVEVPSEVTKVNIVATPEDGTASIKGIGEVEVVEGSNAFEVVVTAQNGNTNTYKLTVNVEDKNPVTFTYNDKKYAVVKRASLLTKPESYGEANVKIGEIEVPGFYNESTKKWLIGAKDEEGNISLFIFNEGNYEKYFELSTGSLTINLENMKKSLLPYGYEKYIATINEQEVEVYKQSKNSKFGLVYGIDVVTGETDLYQIDLKNNTVQLFNKELVKEINKTGNIKVLLVSILLGALAFIEFILIISSNHKKNKILNRIKEDKMEKIKTKAINDAKEETISINLEDIKKENEATVNKKNNKQKKSK